METGTAACEAGLWIVAGHQASRVQALRPLHAQVQSLAAKLRAMMRDPKRGEVASSPNYGND